MLHITMTNNDTEAQLSQNKLESIANQTNVSTSPQINVGNTPFHIDHLWSTRAFESAVYVANLDSDTVSVINLDTKTVKNINVGNGPQFVYIFESPYDNFIYVANSLDGTVSVIDALSNSVIKNITVGYFPISIAESPHRDAIYVANSGDNTVSVITLFDNTVLKNITVGSDPRSIVAFDANVAYADAIYTANSGDNTVSVINPITNDVIDTIEVGNNPIATSNFGDFIYVANDLGGTVSVIDALSNSVVKNITVGSHPSSIVAFEANGASADAIYVANSGDNTVSVINPIDNTVIKNITVGSQPRSIVASMDAIYVANSVSDSISVIDPATNKVVAGVTFDSIPFQGGQIICNDLNAPINRYFYISSGTDCVAKPRSGYEFDSWVQIFDDNSTRTLNASTPSDWLVDPVAAFNDVFIDDPAANLTVNRFGNFTAYFKALPPPVPAEFTASIITVIVAAFVGSLLVPAAVSWLRSKKQTSRLNSFHLQMDHIYADRKLDKNETDQSNILNKDISDSYAAGKISNEQYTHLKNEVSTAYQEIFKKRIGSVTEQNIDTDDNIINEISNAYSNGELSNEHYTNLKNELSNMYQKIFKKRIESITNPNTEAVSKIKNDITDAYSDGKITELHYNLLNQKISDLLNNK
jgi:YVTN family beta-propeller protein